MKKKRGGGGGGGDDDIDMAGGTVEDLEAAQEDNEVRDRDRNRNRDTLF